MSFKSACIDLICLCMVLVCSASCSLVAVACSLYFFSSLAMAAIASLVDSKRDFMRLMV